MNNPSKNHNRSYIMKKRLITILSVLLFLGFGASVTLISPAMGIAQDTQGEVSSENLSNMNWDEEEEQNTDEVNNSDLGSMDWDEGGETEQEDEQSEEALQAELAAEERSELITHCFGFLFFVIYLGGLIGTAYFTRDKKIAVEYPPELLILLHAFWPIEWLLVPLLVKSKKV